MSLFTFSEICSIMIVESRKEIEMELNELKAKIKNHQIPPFLVFTGPEVKAMDIYIKQISKSENAPVIRADSIASIVSKMQTKSFMNSKNIYVIHNDPEFVKEEKAWPKFLDGTMQKDNIVILIEDSLDKRTKFYKSMTALVQFEKLSESILVRYIQKEISLSDKNCNRLIALCESDYSRILLEIDKIKCFGGNADSSFEQLVKDGAIYEPPKDAIFDFVDAVLRGEIKRSHDLLSQCYAVGESPIVLISVLYNNFKSMLQVQSYKGNNITQATGLTGFQVKLAKEKMGAYSIRELIDAMTFIREVEVGIKTGKYEQQNAVDIILAHIL